MVSALAFIVRRPIDGSFAQIGHKAPVHEHQFALTVVTIEADDGLKSLRRYVPARLEVGQGRAMNGEVLGNAFACQSAERSGHTSRKCYSLGIFSSRMQRAWAYC